MARDKRENVNKEEQTETRIKQGRILYNVNVQSIYEYRNDLLLS